MPVHLAEQAPEKGGTLTIEQNKAALFLAITRFNDPSQRASYFELCSDDAVLHGYSGVEPGIGGIKQFYATFWTAFPDATVTIGNLTAEEDRLACCFTMKGTHTGQYLAIQATGRSVSFSGITILRFVNGRCTERWSQIP